MPSAYIVSSAKDQPAWQWEKELEAKVCTRSLSEALLQRSSRRVILCVDDSVTGNICAHVVFKVAGAALHHSFSDLPPMSPLPISIHNKSVFQVDPVTYEYLQAIASDFLPRLDELITDLSPLRFLTDLDPQTGAMDMVRLVADTSTELIITPMKKEGGVAINVVDHGTLDTFNLGVEWSKQRFILSHRGAHKKHTGVVDHFGEVLQAIDLKHPNVRHNHLIQRQNYLSSPGHSLISSTLMDEIVLDGRSGNQARLDKALANLLRISKALEEESDYYQLLRRHVMDMLYTILCRGNSFPMVKTILVRIIPGHKVTTEHFIHWFAAHARSHAFCLPTFAALAALCERPVFAMACGDSTCITRMLTAFTAATALLAPDRAAFGRNATGSGSGLGTVRLSSGTLVRTGSPPGSARGLSTGRSSEGDLYTPQDTNRELDNRAMHELPYRANKPEDGPPHMVNSFLDVPNDDLRLLRADSFVKGLGRTPIAEVLSSESLIPAEGAPASLLSPSSIIAFRNNDASNPGSPNLAHPRKAQGNKTGVVIPLLPLPSSQMGELLLKTTTQTRSSRRMGMRAPGLRIYPEHVTSRSSNDVTGRAEVEPIHRKPTEKMEVMAYKMGESFMTSDLSALIAHKRAHEVAAALKRGMQRQESEASVENDGTTTVGSGSVIPKKKVSSTPHLTVGQPIRTANIGMRRVKCYILLTLHRILTAEETNLGSIHNAMKPKIITRYKPVNLLYAEMVVASQNPGELPSRALILEVLGHYAHHVEATYLHTFSSLTKQMSLDRKDCLRRKLDVLIWRLHGRLSTIVNLSAADGEMATFTMAGSGDLDRGVLNTQLEVLLSYMKGCRTRAMASQVVDVCIEVLMLVKQQIMALGRITAGRVYILNTLSLLLSIFHEIILQNLHIPLNDLLLAMFVERTETWHWLLQYANEMVASHTIEQEIMKSRPAHDAATARAQVLHHRLVAARHLRICAEMVRHHVTSQQQTAAEDPAPAATVFGRGPTPDLLLSQRQSEADMTEPTGRGPVKWSVGPLLVRFEPILTPDSGLLALYLTSSTLNVAENHAVTAELLSFVKVFFSVPGNPFLVSEHYMDAYINLHYISFIRLYHAQLWDEMTLQICRLHLDILITLALAHTPPAVLKFYQLRAMEFLVREMDSEARVHDMSRQQREESMSDLSVISRGDASSHTEEPQSETASITQPNSPRARHRRHTQHRRSGLGARTGSRGRMIPGPTRGGPVTSTPARVPVIEEGSGGSGSGSGSADLDDGASSDYESASTVEDVNAAGGAAGRRDTPVVVIPDPPAMRADGTDGDASGANTSLGVSSTEGEPRAANLPVGAGGAWETPGAVDITAPTDGGDSATEDGDGDGGNSSHSSDAYVRVVRAKPMRGKTIVIPGLSLPADITVDNQAKQGKDVVHIGADGLAGVAGAGAAAAPTAAVDPAPKSAKSAKSHRSAGKSARSHRSGKSGSGKVTPKTPKNKSKGPDGESGSQTDDSDNYVRVVRPKAMAGRKAIAIPGLSLTAEMTVDKQAHQGKGIVIHGELHGPMPAEEVPEEHAPVPLASAKGKGKVPPLGGAAGAASPEQLAAGDESARSGTASVASSHSSDAYVRVARKKAAVGKSIRIPGLALPASATVDNQAKQGKDIIHNGAIDPARAATSTPHDNVEIIAEEPVSPVASTVESEPESEAQGADEGAAAGSDDGGDGNSSHSSDAYVRIARKPRSGPAIRIPGLTLAADITVDAQVHVGKGIVLGGHPAVPAIPAPVSVAPIAIPPPVLSMPVIATPPVPPPSTGPMVSVPPPASTTAWGESSPTVDPQRATSPVISPTMAAPPSVGFRGALANVAGAGALSASQNSQIRRSTTVSSALNQSVTHVRKSTATAPGTPPLFPKALPTADPGALYASERSKRRIYQDTQLHVCMVRLVIALYITPLGVVDTRYIDDEAADQRPLNVQFYLRCHLNAAANERILPYLSSRIAADSRGTFRAFKLLSQKMFNLNAYQLNDRLGHGFYGSVKGAIHAASGTRVAIKQIPLPPSLHDTSTLHDLITETLIMEQARPDRRVCGLYDYGVDGENAYLVMEAYPMSLGAWRAAQTGSLNDRLELYLNVYGELLEAASYLPIGRVIHFDLKADNILLIPFTPDVTPQQMIDMGGPIPNFTVCLADFGVSKVYDGPIDDAITTRGRGTECIKSPEMLAIADNKTTRTYDRRRPAGAGAPSDVWSLGCLFYELLTGQMLFRGSEEDMGMDQYVRLGAEGSDIIPPDRREALSEVPMLLEFLTLILVRHAHNRPTLEDVKKQFNRMRRVLFPKDGDMMTPSTAGPRTAHTATSQRMLTPQLYSAGGSTIGPALSATFINSPTPPLLVRSPPVLPAPGVWHPMVPSRHEARYFARHASRITPHLYVGSAQVAGVMERLKELGITHIVNTCTNVVHTTQGTQRMPRFESHFLYLNLRLEDDDTEDIRAVLPDVFDFVDAAVRDRGKVLFASDLGQSRSVLLCAAYLVHASGHMRTVVEGLAAVTEARYIASPRPSFVSQIADYDYFRRSRALSKQRFRCLCGANVFTLTEPLDGRFTTNPRPCRCTVDFPGEDCPYVGCNEIIKEMAILFSYTTSHILWGFTPLSMVEGDIQSSTVEADPMANVPELMRHKVMPKEWRVFRCKVCRFVTHAVHEQRNQPNWAAVVCNLAAVGPAKDLRAWDFSLEPPGYQPAM